MNGRRSRAWRALAYLVFLVVAVEGLGQLLVYALGVNLITVPDAELGWRYEGWQYQLLRFHSSHVFRTNALGLRADEEYSAPVRRMLLGDSVTMGRHVALADTFAARLGAVNAGFAGYDTIQLRDRFRRDLWTLRPELLGYVICPNDLMGVQGHLENIAGHGRMNPHVSRPAWWQALAWYPLRQWVELELRRDLKEAFRFDQAFMWRKISRDLPDDEWSEWTGAVRAIAERQRPGAFVLVYVPPLIQLQRSDRPDAGRLAARIGAFAAAEGFGFFDATPSFATPDFAGLYVDAVHLSRAGHARVAAALEPYLRGLETRSPAPATARADAPGAPIDSQR
jgi:hypothetical protein